MRISWHWLLIIAIASQPLMPFMTTFDMNKLPDFTLIFFLLWLILVMAGWSSIAVLWHRRLLRNEEIKGLPIRLDACAAHYLGRIIFILILVGIPVGLAKMIGGDQITLARLDDHSIFWLAGLARNNFLMFSIGLLISLVIIVISLRLSVALPDAALADDRTTPGKAWAVTAGNGLRLLAIAVLTSLPLFIFNGLLLWISEGLIEGESRLHLLFYNILWEVGRLVPLLLGVSLLSIVYAEPIEKKSIAPMANVEA